MTNMEGMFNFVQGLGECNRATIRAAWQTSPAFTNTTYNRKEWSPMVHVACAPGGVAPCRAWQMRASVITAIQYNIKSAVGGLASFRQFVHTHDTTPCGCIVCADKPTETN